MKSEIHQKKQQGPEGPQGNPADQLAKLIALERQARKCSSLKELTFTIVNQTARLVPYYRAVFVLTSSRNVVELGAVSGVSQVEKKSPFSLWVTLFSKALLGKYNNKLTPVKSDELGDSLKDDWNTWLPEEVLYCPFTDSENNVAAVLLLSREQPFHPGELSLLEILLESYNHSWTVLGGGHRKRFGLAVKQQRLAIALVGAILLGLLVFLDVPESVLAPAEIVSTDPVIVTSPASGIIKDIDVVPYQVVEEGQRLFHLDDTEIVNKLALTEKSLEVVQADYLRAAQKAFQDSASKADLELYKIQVEEKQLVVNYTRQELERQKVASELQGVVLFRDRNDLIGRSVAVGEKVMTLADPEKVELKIMMPVDDAISLELGAPVKLFLHTDPLNPVSAILSRSSFKAQMVESGAMVFPLRAQVLEGNSRLRIGLQGTAKVYGGSVPLYYYLFRKPLSFFRRSIGI